MLNVKVLKKVNLMMRRSLAVSWSWRQIKLKSNKVPPFACYITGISRAVVSGQVFAPLASGC